MRALVRCDGAPIPPALRRQQWDICESVNQHGPLADTNLRLQNLSHALLARVEERAADLVRLAAYVYAADQLVSRGGLKDVYGRHWQREFMLVVPVGEPRFWNLDEVRARLGRVLSFLSGDRWHFFFCQGDPEAQQLPLDMAEGVPLGDPDCVALFSGGADSLCAAVEAASVKGQRPVLISHRPAPHIDARQKALVHELRCRFQRWDFPHISVWVHRKGSEARESTQRTRSFLYASLGAAVANQLGLRDVLLPDNGVVSLNLPISGQLVGTLASRSTHPKFIGLFNDFVGAVLPGSPQIVNPLWTRTRAEVLEILKSAGMSELLQETISCTQARGRPAAQPHCGGCFQCIDRRFGSMAAGLQEHDLAERYGLDIFCQSLPEGGPRTLALSYIQFARELDKTPEGGLFDVYPQLYECLIPDEPGVEKTAEELVGLLRRHARTILGVMEDQIAAWRSELVVQGLPSTCLVSLTVSPGGAADHDFRHSDDYASVSVHGRHFSFTQPQAKAISILHEAYTKGLPDVQQRRILSELDSYAASLRDVFKRSGAWQTLVVAGERRGTYRLNLDL